MVNVQFDIYFFTNSPYCFLEYVSSAELSEIIQYSYRLRYMKSIIIVTIKFTEKYTIEI